MADGTGDRRNRGGGFQQRRRDTHAEEHAFNGVERGAHVARLREVADDDFGAQRAKAIGSFVGVVHHRTHAAPALAQQRYDFVAQADTAA